MPFDVQTLDYEPLLSPLNADLDWDPVLGELEFDGEPVPPDMAKAVYRSDTRALLGIVGSRYHPIPHRGLIASFEAMMINSGLDTDETHRQVRVLENGAKIHASYMITNKVVEPRVGDTMWLKFDFRTSNNSTWGVSLRVQYFRLVCKNGMVLPRFTHHVYGRHTQGFNSARLAARMHNAVEMIGQDQELFERYARTPISRWQAADFIERTLARIKTGDRAKAAAKTGERVINEKRRDQILANFDNEESTVWGLYNAMTAWSTHAHSKRRGAEHNSLIRREDEVANTLQSREFMRLVLA